jgi:hypothetical protein
VRAASLQRLCCMLRALIPSAYPAVTRLMLLGILRGRLLAPGSLPPRASDSGVKAQGPPPPFSASTVPAKMREITLLLPPSYAAGSRPARNIAPGDLYLSHIERGWLSAGPLSMAAREDGMDGAQAPLFLSFPSSPTAELVFGVDLGWPHAAIGGRHTSRPSGSGHLAKVAN